MSWDILSIYLDSYYLIYWVELFMYLSSPVIFYTVSELGIAEEASNKTLYGVLAIIMGFLFA